jgi:PAS domain S-box-containing protein
MDTKTLFIFISISAICVLGLSIHVYWRHSRFIRGSGFWLAAIFSISVSSIAFSASGVLPAWFNIHASNSLLLLCPTLMSLSFRRLYNNKLSAIPLTLYALSFIIFNLSAPSITVNNRIIIFSLLFGIQWMEPAYLCLRKENRKYDSLLGASFLVVSVGSIIRAGATPLYEKELNSLLDGSGIQQTYVIVMGLMLFMFLAGYTLMLNYRTQERLENNKATIRAAIDNSPYGIVMTDQTGKVTSINASFERMTGYNLLEMQEHGLNQLEADEQQHQFSNEILYTLQSKRVWQGEIYSKRKNGACFWKQVVWSPIKMESGQITGFFGVIIDITEKRQLEDLKNEFEHLMRHDLKTPLNAVINFPEMIQEDGNLSDEQNECLDLIRESGESMLEQINSSLEMHKLEEGSYRTRSEPADLTAVLSALRKTLLTLAEKRKIGIQCTYESQKNDQALAALNTDLPLFKRLIGNLLKNAVEASPDNGEVEIRVTEQDDQQIIAIHNQGAIPLAARERFFGKFNTIDKFNGTGLGAYSSKLIADTLGYGLSFTTDEEAGTTLLIRIPNDNCRSV